MKLIKLSSNKETFKTVNFNPKGITLIVGKKEAPTMNQKKKTYNAVGKTLIINIIHFCLGANAKDEFVNGLPGWEFYLDIEIDGTPYRITRKTDEFDKIFINNDMEGLKKNAFTNKMDELLFSQSFPNSSAGFRGLIQRFIRNSKASYNEAESPVKDEQPYVNLTCNSFLLGLDVNLVIKKFKLKTDLDNNEKLKKNIDNDPVLKDFYTSNKDVDIELAFLSDQIEKLDKSLSSFEVAEDFHHIKKSADSIAETIHTRENKRQLLEISIENIKNSLKIKSDLPLDFVYKTFENAKLVLNEHITKQIDEVVDFHKNLIHRRRDRLEAEKTRLQNDLDSVMSSINSLGKELNEQLKYLNNHRALDEFVALSNKLSDLRIQEAKLGDYKRLLAEYDLRKTKLKREIIDSHAEAVEYLDSINRYVLQVQGMFRELAVEFYEDKPAGISILPNEGMNQIRFNIRPKIQSDTSDGVNEVKIFCYDMTLLRLQKNHKIKFLFHDSCLFSDMDPRQRETAFRTAHKVSNANQMQYIATVNQDQLESFKDQMNPGDFKNIIENSVTLELTDKSAATKLLGIDIDLEYL